MTSWWLRYCKNIELHQRYESQPQPKCNRVKFISRVKKYWYAKEQAISSERYIFQAKRNQHIKRDENWRVCNTCKQYKARDEFSYNRVWFHHRSPNCKECRNKKHREYRMNWWSEKDKEYRIKKRHLTIWEQVYFHWQIREVIDKKYNWYIVKNIITEETRRISTSDNHYRPNNSCVRFQKLVENVKLVETQEEEIEERPKFELSIEPDEDDENYYY